MWGCEIDHWEVRQISSTAFSIGIVGSGKLFEITTNPRIDCDYEHHDVEKDKYDQTKDICT